jgi:hypothetical protein
LVCAAEFGGSCTIFCILRSPFDDAIPLIRVLNPDLCDFAVDPDVRFSAWQQIACHSLRYFVDVAQAQSHGRDRLFWPNLFSCDSISSMIDFVFRMFAIDSFFCENVNHFLRCFPISRFCNFNDEMRGILNFIYLLQSSIACRSQENPIRENVVVYCGIGGASDVVMLYESMIDDVVVWCEFTRAFTDRDYVMNELITDDDFVLFEIELHPGDVAVLIEGSSDDQIGDEFLIAASTGFKVVSVEETEVSICGEDGILNFFHLPIVRLSYFLHWYDFDLDQRAGPVFL